MIIKTTDPALAKACHGSKRLMKKVYLFFKVTKVMIDGKPQTVIIAKYPITYSTKSGKIPMEKGKIKYSKTRVISARMRASQYHKPSIREAATKILHSL